MVDPVLGLVGFFLTVPMLCRFAPPLGVVRVGVPEVRVGSPLVRVGSPLVRVGVPDVRVGSPLVRVGSPPVRCGSEATGLRCGPLSVGAGLVATDFWLGAAAFLGIAFCVPEALVGLLDDLLPPAGLVVLELGDLLF